jgi:cysteine desulfurase
MLSFRPSMVYLDNAASTPMAPEVLAAWARAAEELPANPASAHALGAAAARALETARGQVAGLLRAAPAEIVFTSGGTEANALAVLGSNGRGKHVVVTAIEHPSVLRNADLLRGRGFSLALVAPERCGAVTVEAVLAAVTSDTALVAVMLVNNELGTVQPVAEIARALRAAGHRSHLHVDAVQAAAAMPLDVRTLGADSVAISAHKLGGPKGVGALWLRPGARLTPLWDGGRQEGGLRSGTENLPGCVAFGRAAVLGREAEATAPARMASLRDELEAAVMAELPEVRPTVTGVARAPHIASLIVPDLPAEPVLHALETRGVIASAGSACASRSRAPNPVLAAVGVDERAAVLRFSLGRYTTRAEIAQAVQALADAVAEIRSVAGMGRQGRNAR